jgi:adenine specific DNA methylase Mod
VSDGLKLSWEGRDRSVRVGSNFSFDVLGKFRDSGDTSGWNNVLILGDNEKVMSVMLNEGWKGKIDMIYIDPPFFSGRRYWKCISNKRVLIYGDIWRMLDDYLQFLYERLVLMKELLADDGSIFVHLDCRVSHYVKIIMDEIFGFGGKKKPGFRNEIIWAYRTGGASGKEPGFSKKHDVILFYSKSGKPKFNNFKERIYYEKAFFISQKDENGRYYADVFLRDVWEGKMRLIVDDRLVEISVKPVINTSRERMDFDTQKPEGLLQILIMATTDFDDIVADFFCGSGTTLVVAEKLGRRWIGCDNSEVAIEATKNRLLNIEFKVEGSARDICVRPFELWCVRENVA